MYEKNISMKFDFLFQSKMEQAKSASQKKCLTECLKELARGQKHKLCLDLFWLRSNEKATKKITGFW